MVPPACQSAPETMYMKAERVQHPTMETRARQGMGAAHEGKGSYAPGLSSRLCHTCCVTLEQPLALLNLSFFVYWGNLPEDLRESQGEGLWEGCNFHLGNACSWGVGGTW